MTFDNYKNYILRKKGDLDNDSTKPTKPTVGPHTAKQAESVVAMPVPVAQTIKPAIEILRDSTNLFKKQGSVFTKKETKGAAALQAMMSGTEAVHAVLAEGALNEDATKVIEVFAKNANQWLSENAKTTAKGHVFNDASRSALIPTAEEGMQIAGVCNLLNIDAVNPLTSKLQCGTVARALEGITNKSSLAAQSMRDVLCTRVVSQALLPVIAAINGANTTESGKAADASTFISTLGEANVAHAVKGMSAENRQILIEVITHSPQGTALMQHALAYMSADASKAQQSFMTEFNALTTKAGIANQALENIAENAPDEQIKTAQQAANEASGALRGFMEDRGAALFNNCSVQDASVAFKSLKSAVDLQQSQLSRISDRTTNAATKKSIASMQKTLSTSMKPIENAYSSCLKAALTKSIEGRIAETSSAESVSLLEKLKAFMQKLFNINNAGDIAALENAALNVLDLIENATSITPELLQSVQGLETHIAAISEKSAAITEKKNALSEAKSADPVNKDAVAALKTEIKSLQKEMHTEAKELNNQIADIRKSAGLSPAHNLLGKQTQALKSNITAKVAKEQEGSEEKDSDKTKGFAAKTGGKSESHAQQDAKQKDKAAGPAVGGK